MPGVFAIQTHAKSHVCKKNNTNDHVIIFLKFSDVRA